MRKSNSFDLRLVGALTACAIACCSSLAYGEVNLSLLSRCDDVARLYESLRANPSMPSNCRDPRGPIEAAIAARTGADAKHVCFQERPGFALVSGFSCARTASPKGASLTCFRGASSADVMRYQDEAGERYAKPTKDYLDATAKCSVGARHTSASAQNTQQSPLLASVSSFEFGFIRPLGTAVPPNSSIVHGYASTDPALPSGVPSALEFVYVLVDMPPFAADADKRQVGKWLLTVDSAKEMTQGFNEQARRSHASLALSVRGYTLAQDTVVATPQQAKLAQLKKLQDNIARNFEYEGFESISDADLKRTSGMTMSQMLEKAQGAGTPFAWKSAPVKLAPFARVLINQKRPSCTRGDGAFAAYVVSAQPLEDAAADFGQVAVMILGMGACSRGSSVVREFVDGLLDEASDEVLKELGKP